jgi:hypothetical protein
MKKILILILAMAMASAAIFADDEELEQDNSDRMAKMQKNLGLTDQQVSQMRRIRDEGGSKEEILAVLTRNQLAIMKQRQAEMKGKGRKRKRQAPAEDVEYKEEGSL